MKTYQPMNAYKTIKSFVILILAIGICLSSSFAREAEGGKKQSSGPAQRPQAGGCTNPTAKNDLDISGVRATILTGGDMWWDLNSAKYEVPKVSDPKLKRYAIFAGELWIGGIDENKQLRLAAQTYRQTGNDFWPGPIDTAQATTDVNICTQYDKHWKLNRTDVEAFAKGPSFNPSGDIDSWPGNGIGDNFIYGGKYLAPFKDVDGDGKYTPAAGDYPRFFFPGEHGEPSDISLLPNRYKDLLLGDQVLWWVFNDKGNIHSESTGNQIGLEVQSMAFAFDASPDDPLQAMTFYTFKVINRGTYTLKQTYFGVFCDADLGNYKDDYVGCDANLGLGYCYNGDNFDENTTTYGYSTVPGRPTTPPAIGMDFFEGPLADPDGIDNPPTDTRSGINYGNGKVDDEHLGMAKFMYFNNDYTVKGNPQIATDYYGYLKGIWKDGKPMTYGGDGHGASAGSTSELCDFMFPDNTDNAGGRASWTEKLAGNIPDDRRFVESSGPFTLKPGAVNYITFGIVFAQASSGDNTASIPLMKLADIKAQKLFDNNFKNLRGPSAASIDIRELDKKLVFTIENDPAGNNYKENYHEDDPTIVDPDPVTGAYNIKGYDFQGYQIFQLKNSSITAGDIFNSETHQLDIAKARLVYEADLKDSITVVENYYRNSFNTFFPAQMVYTTTDFPSNSGIQHSFQITKDAFNDDTGSPLVNNKTYYYVIVTYAVNRNQIKYNELLKTNPVPTDNKGYFLAPYIPSKSFVIYKAIPHIPSAENYGTKLNSDYGDKAEIQKVAGSGNAGQPLDLTQDAVDKLITESSNGGKNYMDTVYYKAGKGPFEVKVTDPVAITPSDFVLTFAGTTPGSSWTLTNKTTNEKVSSSLSNRADQIQKKWGFSIKLFDAVNPGDNGGKSASLDNGDNGQVEDDNSQQIVYQDTTKKWLTGIPDADADSITLWYGADQKTIATNWILAGNLNKTTAAKAAPSAYDYPDLDNNEYFEQDAPSLKKTWAPFALAAPGDTLDHAGVGTGSKKVFATNTERLANFNRTSSVMLVITPDKSKWTRSPVIEMNVRKSGSVWASFGGTPKYTLRKSPSVDKNGQADNTGTTGMGWFPGYAIDMVSGERLNIMFGEDSFLPEDNGRDMLWNPTSRQVIVTQTGNDNLNQKKPDINRIIGGKHYIYIVGHGESTTPAYDEGRYIYSQLSGNNVSLQAMRNVYTNVMWTSMCVLNNGYSMNNGVPPTEVKIRLLASKAFTNKRRADDASPSNPVFTFTTKNLAPSKNDNKVAKASLDMIRVVPNPYYAHSEYEIIQYDNLVKITNLPNKCRISIYTVDGTLIRTIDRDASYDTGKGVVYDANSINEPENAYTWDLKNNAGVTIASGIYLIHVKADGIGEKVIKWFGVLRPLDIQN